MIDVECVVIGGGVVGLAVTRALAMAGRETLLVERHPTVGCETSSRNSEVIHAGLYYPQGSLKATSCVRGNSLLYEYCESAGVPYRKCGKLIVATDESQVTKLHAIRDAAGRNGVLGMAMLSSQETRAMEPQLECVAALHSPATGIVDSHAFMLSLLGDAEHHGATCAFRSSVERLSINGHGIHVWTDAAGTTPLACRWLINCAGLDAVSVARRMEGFPAQHIPQAFLAKGSYFSLAVHAPFSRLVYPVPEPGGLGVHLTLDQAGRARFGPDVQWVETIDYDVDPARSAGFYGAIRKYWPGLPDGALEPAYAGMRPKITGPGDAAGDFRIDGPAVHGVPGVINLFGIESPGLTASLAIADHVVQLVAE